MLRSWNDSLVRFPVIGIEGGLLAINQRNPLPELLRALAAAVANLEGKALSALCINGDPDPLPVGFLTNKTPHFIGFGFESQEVHSRLGGGWQLHVEIIGQAFIDLGDEAQEPTQADAHNATDAQQREAFKQQALDHLALGFANALRVCNALAPAVEAAMILFAIVSVAIAFDMR